MHVQRAGLDPGVSPVTPDPLHQRLPREDSPARFDHLPEKIELLGGQLHEGAALARFATVEIELDPADAKDALGGPIVTQAQEHAEPQEQVAAPVGARHEVLGARERAQVLDLGARGTEQEHGKLREFLPEKGPQRGAAPAVPVEIDHRGIERLPRHLQGGAPVVAGDGNAEPRGLETRHQGALEDGVVLDEKDPRPGHAPRTRESRPRATVRRGA